MNLAARIALLILIGLPAAAVATRLVRLKATTAVAILQDAIPVLLILAWLGLAMAVVRSSWFLASVAAALCVYHVMLIARLARRASTPSWVRVAPKTRVAVANVYVANDEMEASARQLVATDADVLVVVETTERFRAAFDAAGGRDRFPHAVFDPDDDSRLPPVPRASHRRAFVANRIAPPVPRQSQATIGWDAQDLRPSRSHRRTAPTASVSTAQGCAGAPTPASTTDVIRLSRGAPCCFPGLSSTASWPWRRPAPHPTN